MSVSHASAAGAGLPDGWCVVLFSERKLPSHVAHRARRVSRVPMAGGGVGCAG